MDDKERLDAATARVTELTTQLEEANKKIAEMTNDVEKVRDLHAARSMPYDREFDLALGRLEEACGLESNVTSAETLLAAGHPSVGEGQAAE